MTLKRKKIFNARIFFYIPPKITSTTTSGLPTQNCLKQKLRNFFVCTYFHVQKKNSSQKTTKKIDSWVIKAENLDEL